MPEEASVLKVCLFGNASVTVNDGVVSGRLARKELWLLALLALRQGRAVPREYLAGLLWPDCEEAQALYNLRRSLTRLRDALGSQADCVEQVKPRSLTFAAPRACVDALEFDRLAASEDPQLLADAVNLCRGPLLQNCDEEWTLPERVPREFAYLKALETLASRALLQKEWLEAAKYCRLHIAADPLHEQAHRLLMQALAHSGNHAAASQVYRDLRVRLREEINADPDPETVALYESLRQRAQQAAPAPAKVVRQPAPLAVEPPCPPVISVPQPLTRLIGRELEALEVCGYLGGSRLVTLLGAGGVGKTRLALEVTHRTARRMAEGAVWVELASTEEAMLAPRTVARTLGLKEDADTPLLTMLTRALQDQERLLVLDNCEHLRNACAELAHVLLAACPRLRILATSRQALRLPGEVVWRVPSLPVPPAEDESALTFPAKGEDTLEYASVQLFLERVAQACPEFRLSPAQLPFIAQICRQLDGIPLAIELAAYRVRSLSPEKIAVRLSDRFHLLTGGGTASLPRQQTLRALIDWSYRLLEPEEQSLLARLSVFSGGWTLEAAEEVCAGQGVENWELLDLLTSLIDKSLVTYAPGEEGGRYQFLESIRAYGQERLEETGQTATYRQRHAETYAALAVATEPRLLGPEQGPLQEMLEREHDNMRAALAWGRANAAGTGTALKLAAWLWRFWMQRGHWREGREHLAAVLEPAAIKTDLDSRGRALNGAGMLAYRMGDFAQARALLEECLTVWQDLGDARGIAATLGNLGHIPAAEGDFAEAQKLYAQALAFAREQGNESAMAYSLLGLGNVAGSLGDLAALQTHYGEALVLFRRIQDPGGELLTLGNLGAGALMQDDGPLAMTYSKQALELCRQLQRPEAEALYLPILGAASELAGDMTKARECYHESLHVALQLGDKRALAATIATIAAYYMRLQDDETAVRYFGCAYQGYERIALCLSVREQKEREEAFALLRARMGTDTFQACLVAGQQRSLEELAREALSE